MNESPTPRGGVSVVLPTYNEKDNIGPLILAVLKHMPPDTEVIVVDDDSPDGTWKVVEDLRKTLPALRLIRRTDERGLTSALRAGIAAATGEIVVWSDCDFSMPPAKMEDLLAEIGRGGDVAVGSRFVEGGGVRIVHGSGDTLMAYLMSRILNGFIQGLLGREIRDYTSGFIAVRKRVLDLIPLKGDYGEYFIDLVHRARKMGFAVVESPYLCVERRSGEGKRADVLRLPGQGLEIRPPDRQAQVYPRAKRHPHERFDRNPQGRGNLRDRPPPGIFPPRSQLFHPGRIFPAAGSARPPEGPGRQAAPPQARQEGDPPDPGSACCWTEESGWSCSTTTGRS